MRLASTPKSTPYTYFKIVSKETMSRYKKIINGLKKMLPSFGTARKPPLAWEAEHIHSPKITPRAQHSISRKNISRNALKVLYKLKDAGYDAYLVGGGVRDMLLGVTPKDFDVATNAKPEDISAIFRNCRLIGRRFRLAHIHFGTEIIEVATFRAQPGADEAKENAQTRNGMIVRDNVYGTFEQDAWRRDFTINALYYNIHDFSVVDYTHQGMSDLQNQVLRLIGDPWQRYREDPVRMLRAVRFRAKLGFALHPDTESPIRELGRLLNNIPPSRLYEETLKLLQSTHAVESYRLLQHYGLLAHLFSLTAEHLQAPGGEKFILAMLANTEQRLIEHKTVAPVFLFAVLLWQPMQTLWQRYQQQSTENPQTCLHEAGHEIFHQQNHLVMIPKRLTVLIREIWFLQYRIEKATGAKKALRVLSHPRFRAALDFLMLRAQSDLEIQATSAWWQQLAQANEAQRQVLFSQPPTGSEPNATSSATRRRRRKKKPNQQALQGDSSSVVDEV